MPALTITSTIIYLLLLIGLIICIMICCVCYDATKLECMQKNQLHTTTTSKYKPYMWVYWELIKDAKEPPDYIKMCLEIIKKNGSRYFDVVQLNEKNIFDYIPDLRKDINTLPIALKTDYIRVKLLYMYGGLWIDADTILMNNLKDIADKLNKSVDFIGFGCTGPVCKDQEGYGRPSNGVIGSIKHGRLIDRCLKALDIKLNYYFSLPLNKRKEFDYFELGKMIIWTEYDKLMKDDPSYKMYHVPSYSDGTRDINGVWIAKDIIFEKNFTYAHPDKLLVIMLANSHYCGDKPYYNWFCKLNRTQIIKGDFFISKLFRRAYQYDPYQN